MNETFFSERDLFERFGIPSRTAQRWRVTGDGPPYARLGPRKIVYPAAAFEAWLAARTFAHRAEELSKTKDAA